MSTRSANPKQPQAAPIRALFAANLLQRKCACGGAHEPAGECEKYHRSHLTLPQRAGVGFDLSVAPPLASAALPSSGQPSDTFARSFTEAGFGHDFSKVRVHSEGAGRPYAVNHQTPGPSGVETGKGFTQPAGPATEPVTGAEQESGGDLLTNRALASISYKVEISKTSFSEPAPVNTVTVKNQKIGGAVPSPVKPKK